LYSGEAQHLAELARKGGDLVTAGRYETDYKKLQHLEVKLDDVCGDKSDVSELFWIDGGSFFEAEQDLLQKGRGAIAKRKPPLPQ
ncbi:unnamed protein product, partial [Prorocentrum cordatum]